MSADTLADRSSADSSYRRAWWCLALYPFSFLAAFLIGEGILSLLTDDVDEASAWQVLVAAVPALLVFVLPGFLAVIQGRKAMRLGRREGRVPAVVGAAVGLWFAFINAASYLVG